MFRAECYLYHSAIQAPPQELQTVWPDWVIYWNSCNFSKPAATISLPKSPTFLDNFSKGVKMRNNFWATFIDIWRFLRVTLVFSYLTLGNKSINKSSPRFDTRRWELSEWSRNRHFLDTKPRYHEVCQSRNRVPSPDPRWSAWPPAAVRWGPRSGGCSSRPVWSQVQFWPVELQLCSLPEKNDQIS